MASLDIHGIVSINRYGILKNIMEEGMAGGYEPIFLKRQDSSRYLQFISSKILRYGKDRGNPNRFVARVANSDSYPYSDSERVKALYQLDGSRWWHDYVGIKIITPHSRYCCELNLRHPCDPARDDPDMVYTVGLSQGSKGASVGRRFFPPQNKDARVEGRLGLAIYHQDGKRYGFRTIIDNLTGELLHEETMIPADKYVDFNEISL